MNLRLPALLAVLLVPPVVANPMDMVGRVPEPMNPGLHGTLQFIIDRTESYVNDYPANATPQEQADYTVLFLRDVVMDPVGPICYRFGAGNGGVYYSAKALPLSSGIQITVGLGRWDRDIPLGEITLQAGGQQC